MHWQQLPLPLRSLLGLKEAPNLGHASSEQGDVSDIDINMSINAGDRCILPDNGVKRMLAITLYLIGYAALSIRASLYVIVRAMVFARIYTVACRFGLTPSKARNPHSDGESAPLGSSATLLKVENHVLQRKLDEAILNISKLKNDKMDLQDKLRRCLALKEVDLDDEKRRLAELARFQNRSLESQIFAKEEAKTAGANHDERDMRDPADDSIVIITEADDKQSEAQTSRLLAPRPQVKITAPAAARLTVPNAESVQLLGEGKAQPIPVLTTVRPSLPPKVSKTRLKPLMLAARFTVSGSSRRLAKRASNSKLKPGHSNHSTIKPLSHDEDYSSAAAPKPAEPVKLNPNAAVFAPRLQTIAQRYHPDHEAQVQPVFWQPATPQPTIIKTDPTPRYVHLPLLLLSPFIDIHSEFL